MYGIRKRTPNKPLDFTASEIRERRINHSGAPYQRNKAGPFSHTRSQDFLW